MKCERLHSTPSGTSLLTSDFSFKFGVCAIVCKGTADFLEVNGETWGQLENRPLLCRWFNAEQIFIWDHNNLGALYGQHSRTQIDFGDVQDVCVSDAHVFAAYSEEASTFASESAPESQIAVLFSKEGVPILGVKNAQDVRKEPGMLLEIEAVCSSGDDFLFKAYEIAGLWQVFSLDRSIKQRTKNKISHVDALAWSECFALALRLSSDKRSLQAIKYSDDNDDFVCAGEVVVDLPIGLEHDFRQVRGVADGGILVQSSTQLWVLDSNSF